MIITSLFMLIKLAVSTFKNNIEIIQSTNIPCAFQTNLEACAKSKGDICS